MTSGARPLQAVCPTPSNVVTLSSVRGHRARLGLRRVQMARLAPKMTPTDYYASPACAESSDRASSSEGPYHVSSRPLTSRVSVAGKASGPSSAVKT